MLDIPCDMNWHIFNVQSHYLFVLFPLLSIFSIVNLYNLPVCCFLLNKTFRKVNYVWLLLITPWHLWRHFSPFFQVSYSVFTATYVVHRSLWSLYSPALSPLGIFNPIKKRKEWLSPNKKATPRTKTCAHPQTIQLCIWWYRVGILYYELLPRCVIIAADTYCQQLRRIET